MKSDATRAAILATALEAFMEHGYAATSIRDLGTRLEITSAALYYHFPSKLALLEALVTPYLEEMESLLRRFPKPISDTEKRQLLAGYLDIVAQSPEVAELVGRERELEANPLLGPRMTKLVDGMVARLAAPGRGKLARLRATAAMGAIRRPVLRNEIDSDSQVAELLDAAMAALGG